MTADAAFPVLPRRYRNPSELGRGGMGRVLRVEDAQAGGVPRALKLLEAKERLREEAERHLREYQVLARLEHPHILRVYHFHREPATALQFFTSELLSGPSLERYVLQPLTEQNAIEIITQLLRALDYLHSQGWVHADIKPENVLFRSDPQRCHADCCLIDFGLALPEHDPPEKQIVGTVHSIPPERILGARIDRRSDLYSLGVLAFFLLTGRFPFGGPAKTDILDAHLRQAPPSLITLRPAISPALAEIVTSLLAKLPGDRPASAGHVLRSLHEQFGTPAAPESWNTLRAYAQNPQCTGWERPLATALGRVLERTRPAHIDNSWQAVADAVDPAQPTRNLVLPLSPASRTGCRAGMFIFNGASAADLTLFRDHTERRLEMMGIRHARVVARSDEPALVTLMRSLREVDDGALPPTANSQESGGEAASFLALQAADSTAAQAQVVEALDALAKRSPCVILLERFERADTTLFQLLEEISLRESAQNSLGRIAWLGFQFQHPGLFAAQWLSSAEAAHWTESYPLDALDPQAILRWLQVRLPNWSVPPELRDYFEEQSEGSPAMLSRVLSSLVQEGLVRRGWNGWNLAEGMLTTHLTPLVRRMHRSFAQLGARERRVLEALEILGGSADAEWISKISNEPATEVRMILLRLCERRWLEREADGVRYQFRYYFQRKAIRTALSKEGLAQGNARVASWLLEMKASGAEIDPARLARHLLAAGSMGEAAPYARAAAQRALIDGHVLSAIRWLERIVRADPQGTASLDSWKVLDELADLRALWGPPEDTHALRRSALAAARNRLPGAHANCIPQLERKLAISEALRGDAKRAEDRLRAAAAVDANAGGAEESRCRNLVLIEILLQRGALADARICLESIAPLTPDVPPALAGVEFFLRAELAYLAGNPGAAAATFRRGIEHLERLENGDAAAWVAYFLGRVGALDGANSAALHDLHVAAYLFERRREPRRQARVLIELGELSLTLDRLEDGDRYLRAAEELLARAGSEIELPRLSASRGTLLALRGLYKEAKPYLQAAGSWVKTRPVTPWGWMFQLRQGALALRTGRRQAAHQMLHSAAHPERAPHASSVDPWLLWTPIAVEEALSAGEITQAFGLLDASLRAVRERGGPAAQISLWVLRWKVLSRLGCNEEALRLQTSIQQWLARYPELGELWRELSRQTLEAELLREGNEERLALYYLEQARTSSRSADLRKYLFELEEAKYHARRAGATPLIAAVGARIHAARPLTNAAENSGDRAMADYWRRLVQCGNRWWRAQVLMAWSRSRASAGDESASARLEGAARREFERLRTAIPFPVDLPALASSLSVEIFTETCAAG